MTVLATGSLSRRPSPAPRGPPGSAGRTRMMSRRRWALSLFQLGYVMLHQGREEVAQTIYNQGHSLGSGEKAELRQEVVLKGA